MLKVFITIAVFFLFAVISTDANADLESFLSDINVTARADRYGFHANLSHDFGVSLPDVQAIAGRVRDPADLFMSATPVLPC